MLWLKACQRCKGDLAEDRDIDGRYVACFQCGRRLGKDEEQLIRHATAKGPFASAGR